MRYFNGFCFKDEESIFDEYINSSLYCVAGFSYGAIKAVEYLKDHKSRVDKLQLFSPAYFQNKSDKYKEFQLKLFSDDKESYIKKFLKNCSYPSKIKLDSFKSDGTKDELHELLYYRYDKDILKSFVKRGIKIEVYLGEKDKIVDFDSSFSFFKEFATIYKFKNRGHILDG